MKRCAYAFCAMLALLLCACSDRNVERVLPLSDPDAERLARFSAAAGSAVSPVETEAPVETETPVETEAPAEYAFVGSRLSDRYHDPSCRYAQEIAPENRVGWDSAEAAEADGYAPCGVCKPG